MMKLLKGLLVFSLSVLLASTGKGQAEEEVIVLPVSYSLVEVEQEIDEIEYCFTVNSERFGIPVEVYRAIARVESGFDPSAINYNRNGTVDIGLMQINSATARYYGYSPQEVWDICTNVEVASLKLLDCYREFGDSPLTIGCYHSKTPWYMKRYIKKVEKAFYREAGYGLQAVFTQGFP
ncbi:lytic transglycosylase domain-containing protein [Persephonella sp.]